MIMEERVKEITDLLHKFSAFSLYKLDQTRTLNRREQKFLLHSHHLGALLWKLQPNYDCLDINSRRMFHYSSDYIDTKDFQMYHDHHNGKPDRNKARFRIYHQTGDRFFEIKHKQGFSNVQKFRLKVEEASFPLDKQIQQFITANLYIPPRQLEYKLTTTYVRITLFHKRHTEKITLDFGIEIFDDKRTMRLQNLVVMEIKNYRLARNNHLNDILRPKMYHLSNISKYGLGCALLKNGIKYNRFKPLIRNINKITNISDYALA